MNNVWFIADTHFAHHKILKHCGGRKEMLGIEEVWQHDDALVELWNSLIGKKDAVYIVGDFSFGNKIYTEKLLQRLHGEKHLILGNHDKSAQKLPNYFCSISQIKEVIFKASVYPFLREDFAVQLCHYPMLTWNRKTYGTCMVHGHCHGRIDDINAESTDLRIDVGLDAHGFISLENLYGHFVEKTGGEKFIKWVENTRER